MAEETRKSREICITKPLRREKCWKNEISTVEIRLENSSGVQFSQSAVCLDDCLSVCHGTHGTDSR